MPPQFTRLVRFEDSKGDVHFGEAGSDWQKELVGQTVPTYSISSALEEDFPLTGSKVEIAKALHLQAHDLNRWTITNR